MDVIVDVIYNACDVDVLDVMWMSCSIDVMWMYCAMNECDVDAMDAM